MCGIAALFKIKQKNKADLIKNMVDMISHRGPDDEGYVLLKSSSPEFITFLGGDQTSEECYQIDLPYAPKGEIRSWNDDTVDIAFGHRRL
jgi:asparagine synthase (glutamine-hydrolysing)